LFLGFGRSHIEHSDSGTSELDLAKMPKSLSQLPYNEDLIIDDYCGVGSEHPVFNFNPKQIGRSQH
jgi:hypothetical protein